MIAAVKVSGKVIFYTFVSSVFGPFIAAWFFGVENFNPTVKILATAFILNTIFCVLFFKNHPEIKSSYKFVITLLTSGLSALTSFAVTPIIFLLMFMLGLGARPDQIRNFNIIWYGMVFIAALVLLSDLSPEGFKNTSFKVKNFVGSHFKTIIFLILLVFFVIFLYNYLSNQFFLIQS